MKLKFIATKINCFLLAAMISLSALPSFFVSASAAETSESSTEAIMKGLGISEGIAEKDSGDSVTREELAVILDNILGAHAEIKNSAVSDIEDNSHSRQIQAVTALKLMLTYEDGTFRPLEYVTWDSAIRSVISLTGYDRVKSDNADSSAANLRNARRIGLLSGLNPKGKNITWEELCSLIYNSFDAEVLYTFSVSEKNYVSGTGETVLQHYLNLERTEGIVQSAGRYCLSDVRNTDWNSAVIGGKSFKIDDVSVVKPLLGWNAEVFYTYNGRKDTVVYAVSHDERQLKINIMKYDVDEFDENTRVLTYQNGEKQDDIVIPSNADVLVNGTITTKSFKTVLEEMVNGTICGVDNNSDGKADVFIINSRNVYVVDSVNTGQEAIYMKVWNRNGASVSNSVEKLTLKNREKVSVEDMQGYTRALSEIKPWDLIEVEKNEALDTYAIYCPFESVIGTAEYVKGSGKLQEVAIGGKCYALADSYFTSYGQAEELVPGTTYTLKLDSSGRVAAVVKSKTGKGQLGYLIDTDVKKENFCGGEGMLKILTEDGQIQIFTIDKSKVDAVSCKDGTASVSAIENSFATLNANVGSEVARMIIFESDGNQRVTSVNTPYQSSGEGEDSFRAVPLYGSYGFVNKMRRGDTIEGNYMIDSSASVFVIPTGDSQTVRTAEDHNFMVKNAISHLGDGTNVPMQAFKYTDGSYGLDVLVAKQSGEAAINSDSPIYLIESTFKAIDENGDNVSGVYAIAIDVWGGKNRAKYYAVDSDMFDKYTSGDVAQFVLNDKQKITYIRPVLYVNDPDTNVYLSLKKPVEPDDGQWNNYAEPSKVMLAGAYRKEADSLIVNRGPKLLKSGSYTPAKDMSVLAADEADSSRLSSFMSSTYIYPAAMQNMFIFDSDTATFTEAVSGDVVDYVSDPENYSTMMLFTWWGGVRCAVIYQ